MADPLTWSIALTVAAGAFSGFSAIQQGQAQSAAASRQAQIAQNNATLAEQDRMQAIRTAQIDAEDKSRENARQLASIRASMGTNGLEAAGSPLEVLNDVSTSLALDTRRINYEGLARGREGAIKVANYNEQAAGARASASAASTAGYVGAFGSLLSAGAQGTSLYAKGK